MPTEDFEKVESSLKESQKVVWENKKTLTDLKLEQKLLQEERIKLVNEESKLKSMLQDAKLKLKASEERCNYLISDQNKLLKQKEEFIDLELEKKKAFELLNEEVSLKQKEVSSLDKEINLLQKQLKELQESERDLQKKQGELLAKKKFLTNLKLDFEGISKSSKRLLQENKLAKSEIFDLLKPLYELVKPKKGTEKAFAFAMRLYEDTLVVKNQKALEKVVEFAKKENMKGFSLICIEDQEVKTFYNSFFTSSFEVIEEGILKDKQEVLFFYDQSEKNPFLRELELQKIEEDIKVLEGGLKALDISLKEKIKANDLEKQKKSDLDRSLRSLEMKLVEVNFGLQRAISDKKLIDQQLQKVEKEIKEYLEKSEFYKKDLLAWAKNEEYLSQEIKEKNQRFDVLENEIKKVERVLFSLEEGFRKIEIEYKKLQESRFRHKQLEELFNASNKEHEFLQKQLAEEKESIQTKSKELDDSASKMLNEKKALDESLLSFEEDLKEKRKSIADLALANKDKESFIKKIEESLKVEQSSIHKLELFKVESDAKLKAFAETAQNEYGVDIQELNLKIEATLLSVQNEVNDLKADALNYAHVNLGAIEEFQRQKEQEELLRVQLEDLTNSKNELVEILKKLDGESRKLFIDTFQKIRENFKKNFQILFQGGLADLVFVDAQDPLEAGVEIHVQPPGKQMRSIALLSGGEKCLTSLALLFALFEVKPSAFCLLDEVDAPLDEVNVEKFTRILQQFAAKTQFVVVTHNKRTMKAAEVLLGVSMEEKGVSKLLTLAFEKEECLC